MSFTESCNRQSISKGKQIQKGKQAGNKNRQGKRAEAGKLYGCRGILNDLAVIRWMTASYTKGLMRE